MSQFTMWNNNDNAAQQGTQLAKAWGDIQNEQKNRAYNNALQYRALAARTADQEEKNRINTIADNEVSPYQGIGQNSEVYDLGGIVQGSVAPQAMAIKNAQQSMYDVQKNITPEELAKLDEFRGVLGDLKRGDKGYYGMTAGSPALGESPRFDYAGKPYNQGIFVKNNPDYKLPPVKADAYSEVSQLFQPSNRPVQSLSGNSGFALNSTVPNPKRGEDRRDALGNELGLRNPIKVAALTAAVAQPKINELTNYNKELQKQYNDPSATPADRIAIQMVMQENYKKLKSITDEQALTNNIILSQAETTGFGESMKGASQHDASQGLDTQEVNYIGQPVFDNLITHAFKTMDNSNVSASKYTPAVNDIWNQPVTTQPSNAQQVPGSGVLYPPPPAPVSAAQSAVNTYAPFLNPSAPGSGVLSPSTSGQPSVQNGGAQFFSQYLPSLPAQQQRRIMGDFAFTVWVSANPNATLQDIQAELRRRRLI